ncbi:MAG: asparaginase [Cardiobacteriaceae bacterium]|nr:asparaginase [Cardiobacteriaceae bacterium]
MTAKTFKIMVAGGTIAMHATPKGLAVDPHFKKRFGEMLQRLYPDVTYDIEVLNPALDSASATPETWLKLATWVRDNQQSASGFLILHGTDTMAYSASALSHWLAGSKQKVVFTGSQKPLGFEGSDAEANVVLALQCLQDDAHETGWVGLAFGGYLLDGAAARKMDSVNFQAFCSPNQPAWYANGQWQQMPQSALLLEKPSRFWRGETVSLPKQAVMMLYISPHMPASAWEGLDDEHVLAVVIQSYGMGNLPNDQALESALTAAQSRGVVILNTTQCLQGGVAQGTYAAGAARLGVVGGGIHTPESLYSLLYVGLGYGLRGEDLRIFVEQALGVS